MFMNWPPPNKNRFTRLAYNILSMCWLLCKPQCGKGEKEGCECGSASSMGFYIYIDLPLSLYFCWSLISCNIEKCRISSQKIKYMHIEN